MRHNDFRKLERGMALILSLLALLLISAVGLGMIYMSNTESSINGNYKDTQTAFFAMRAGLEEGRDRLRANSNAPLVLPTAPPPAAGSIVYILNPAGHADAGVDTPWVYGVNSPYFDDEFCHESFANPGGAPGTPCTSPGVAAQPPAGSWVTVASTSPNNNSPAALKYKWVRITLKQNWTTGTPGNLNTYVDPGQPAASLVCWDGNLLKERVTTAMGPYADCDLAR